MGLWIAGLLSIILLFIWIGSGEFIKLFRSVSLYIFFGWIIATILAKLFIASTLSLLVYATDNRISTWSAFCLNGMQSFFNQLLPLTGLAYSAAFLHHQYKVRWDHIAAFIPLQFLIPAFVIGCLGCLASLLNMNQLDQMTWALAAIFSTSSLLSIMTIKYWVATAKLPLLRTYLTPTNVIFTKITADKKLIFLLIALHVAALLMRAARLWILFSASDTPITFVTALCLSTIADITFLIQLTPGGMGLREGALIGGATLLGMDIESVAAIALIDRVLDISLVLLIAPFALWHLNSKAPSKAAG